MSDRLKPSINFTLSTFEVEHLVAEYYGWIIEIGRFYQMPGACFGRQEREEYYYACARISDFIDAGAITKEKCDEIAEGIRAAAPPMTKAELEADPELQALLEEMRQLAAAPPMTKAELDADPELQALLDEIPPSTTEGGN